MDQSRTFRNHILRTLARSDLAALAPHLHPVRLPAGKVIEEPGKPIQAIVFLDCGFISVVARGKQDRRIETGFIGFEGMTGVPVILGDDRSPHETFVQAAGSGHCVETQDIQVLMRTHPGLREVFLRFALAYMVQTAHTALANGRARIEERLARWLLMAHDRMERPDLPLTHELLSIMLGVRRPGVTDALHRLEGYRTIRARRGVITILDRERLLEIADASYGLPELEYKRLLADPAHAHPSAGANANNGRLVGALRSDPAACVAAALGEHET
jgi:CRP-like cAMP-binding protein